MAGSEPIYPFNIIATDYENYAVTYFCMDMLGSNIKMDWWNIISKQVTLDQATLEEAEAMLTAAVPDVVPSWWNSRVTSHEDCEYDWTL